MPLSNTFISPAKGKLLCTKICYAYKPNTYSSITKNLLKAFHQSENATKPLTFDLTSFPDFLKLPFPDNISQAQKDKIIHDSIIGYAANMASDAAKHSSPKVSFQDIEMQHAKDVKLIKDNVDSFLQGLFQFRCACAQLHGWTSAMYLVAHQAAHSGIESSDNDDETDANKWMQTSIDLFKDFEKFDLCQMKGWAEDIWKSTDAELATTDGQSTVYTHKAFAEFIYSLHSQSIC